MILESNTLVQERYRVVRRIGQGNMGAIYEAIDERLWQTVALKQTLTSGSAFTVAFEREAKILAELRHPVLPRVIDYFTNDDGTFMVMDFIQGLDLGALLKQRGEPFGVGTVLAWADQVLHALEYLHRQRPPIIHRDIKPQNLKLTAEGQIVLLDFGLAKGKARLKPRDYQRDDVRASLYRLAESKEGTDSEAINTDIFGFTRQYAPPEQIQGAGTDARSDLYALAATLHHLLSGAPPPDALKRLNALGFDSYAHYEAGLEHLLSSVDPQHPRYADLRTYEQKLRDNIEQSRLYGDIPSSQEERADLCDQINALSHDVLDSSFNKLCRLRFPPPDAPQWSADPLRPLHDFYESPVPAAIGTILHTALALDPQCRPASADTMRAQLQAARLALSNGSSAQAADAAARAEPFLPPYPNPLQQPSQPAGRKPARWPLVVIAIVLIIQIALMVMYRTGHAVPPTGAQVVVAVGMRMVGMAHDECD